MSPLEQLVFGFRSKDINISRSIQNSSHFHGYKRAARQLNLVVKKAGLKTIFFKDNNEIGQLTRMVPSCVEKKARSICKNKSSTLKVLLNNGISCPFSQVFSPDSSSEALRFADRLNFNVVTKPSNGSGGRGVSLDICDEETFRKGWKFSIGASKRSNIIVEEKINGFDIRAIVVGGKFSCAVSRVPAHVIGDGRTSVLGLVQEKKRIRNMSNHHKRFPIPEDLIDNKTCVPGFGELIWLSGISNIHQGGEAYDVTDLISCEMKELCEAAGNAIPGLKVGGIDLITSSLTDSQFAKVVEVNTSPNFGIHYYPYKGAAHNPAFDVLTYMLGCRES